MCSPYDPVKGGVGAFRVYSAVVPADESPYRGTLVLVRKEGRQGVFPDAPYAPGYEQPRGA